jgi:hypothetical protein
MESLTTTTPEDYANCNVAGATGISSTNATAEIEQGTVSQASFALNETLHEVQNF